MQRKNLPKKRNSPRLKRHSIYKGKLLSLTLDDFLLGSGKKIRRETVHHPGSCAIVPLLSKKKVVLIRQFRPSVRKTLWEIPAGTLEKGESPKRCAARELSEETGYRAKTLKKVAVFYPSPGFCTEKMVVYVATHLSPFSQKLEEDEAIQPHVFPLKKTEKMIRKGLIQDAKTIVGLLLLPNFL
ncbi:MAG: NUDIX hydrolase [Candidatus Omnitrophica bacterium]|nr:NUDIX hydrolase [Candidatus Omnitrophota bacterium]